MNSFILQTSIDYGLAYEQVEYIYKFHKEEFYQKLEEKLNERKNNVYPK